MYLLLATLLGPGTTMFGLLMVYKEVRPFFWPQIKGDIVKTSIDRRYDGRFCGYVMVPVITYRFYSNDHPIIISASPFATGTLASAEKIANRLQVGSRVIVYVNPHNVYKSCIEPQLSPTSLGITFTGVALSSILLQTHIL